ncbi:Nicotinamidase [Araneus ventricosus]|uniref:nicotinamidase n=1 Tax=Araneus ventricosus TaxID=182803 RepID=A0A4Y2BMS4_ARAVE|nr:Nicotinamidase [Araneus ventricosus]
MAFFDFSLDFAEDSTKLECFSFFDENDKQHLDEDDFKRLIASLLNKNGDTLSESVIKELFVSFDNNADNKIDANEFENLWNNFINPLKHPVTALLVIDVQNDFIDGSLALKHCSAKQDGYEVVPIINDLIEKIQFNVLVYSLDHHPEDHISFYDNIKLYELSNENEKSIEDIKLFDTVLFHGPPKMEQKLWPKHCVSQSWGSELHQNLKVPEDSVLIYKGTNPKIDSYSAFWDNMKLSKTELDDLLKQKKVTHVFVCGLAYDHCVSSTALDALQLGYATVIIDDATRGIDESIIELTKEKLAINNCVLAPCSEIDNIVKGKDIRLEFAQIFARSNTNN